MSLTPLSDLVDKVSTCDPKVIYATNSFRYIDIGAVSQSAKAIDEPASIAGADAPSRARQIIAQDDILISTVRPNLNAVARVTPEYHDAIASTGFAVLRPLPDKLDSAYLYHWVRTDDFIGNMMVQATGQSYPAVSDKIIKSSRIPLPPLDAQKRIAAILDQADALRRLRRRALDRLNCLGQAIFQEMFGDIRQNPAGYPMRRLGEFADCKLGKMLDKGKFQGAATYPYLRNANVRWFDFDLSDLSSMEFRTNEFERFSVRTNDLLICEGGEPGRCAVWRGPDETIFYQKALHRVRIHEPVAKPEYLERWFFEAAQTGLLDDSMTKATIAHLTGEKLKQLNILLPPVELQWRFAARLGTIKTHIAATAHAYESADTLFTALQHRAFRGEL